jgi:Molybdopterin-binding domain of aldehyde dehydrogenase
MATGARKRSGAEPTVTRRVFLEGTLALGGAFVVGFYVPSAGAAADTKGGVFAPNAFIRIDKSGRITLIMPQVEMGQGIYTAIAMILAEELDAALEQVSVAQVDDTKAKSLPGVRQVLVLEDLVAVVGDHMWAAKQGLAARSLAGSRRAVGTLRH